LVNARNRMVANARTIAKTPPLVMTFNVTISSQFKVGDFPYFLNLLAHFGDEK